MTFLFLLLKPLLIMAVKKVFRKQMKVFAVEMLQEYALSSDNDVDDALVLKVKNAMRLGAV